MNLEKLFQKQLEFDDRVNKEHGLEEQDLLSDKILALRVELDECANEVKCFKFWKTNKNVDKTRVLEEFVDVIHLALSIGLELDISRGISLTGITSENLTEKFHQVHDCISDLRKVKVNEQTAWIFTMRHMLGLGEMLGFTWEQIQQAYMDKNKVNHERQDNQY